MDRLESAAQNAAILGSKAVRWTKRSVSILEQSDLSRKLAAEWAADDAKQAAHFAFVAFPGLRPADLQEEPLECRRADRAAERRLREAAKLRKKKKK